ncbi:hypothetical protein ACRALDRAFT_2026692 [Sodiomyces alcalophilus JCM 7366]|uniref:uncharacterized protein n=1 Tax=Sodiomyces alcalophilus JCM 7366 TaxID=591952 RepID=UPI0039B6D4B7
MACWSALPRELQDMIFDELYMDPERRPEHHVLAKCASVCRSWQGYFEDANFSTLVLSQSCLPKFRLLWLRIRLDEYDCRVCQTAEDAETIKKCVSFHEFPPSALYTYIWSLLRILSTWEKPQAQALAEGHQGLELEISVHSPSDHQHVFRPFCLQDDYPHQGLDIADPDDYEALRLRHAEEAAIHDPPHGWTHGVHTVPNPSGTRAGNPSGKDRLFGTRPLDFDFSRVWPRLNVGTSARDRRLPRARIVTAFTVRRASFRAFSAKVLFKLLHESFTHIAKARIERWLEIYTDQQIAYELEFERLLRSKGLPKTLTSFYLLQESNPTLHQCIACPVYDAALGIQLSRASRHLKHLSITWQADAATFFYEFFPNVWDGASPGSPATEKWENLTTLSLTASYFDQDDWRGSCRLLRVACTAAKLMPRLANLQIWNCSNGSAALFWFQLRDDTGEPPQILWTSTWPTPLSPQHLVFQCWRHLARERDKFGREPAVIAFVMTPEPPDQLQSRWGFLKYLMQKYHILHPITLHQVKWETFKRHGWAEGSREPPSNAYMLYTPDDNAINSQLHHYSLCAAEERQRQAREAREARPIPPPGSDDEDGMIVPEPKTPPPGKENNPRRARAFDTGPGP